MQALVNTGVAGLTTNYLWFAVVFWVYLETESILATAVLSGGYMLLMAASSMWFGSMIDRHHKHAVMVSSGVVSLAAFLVALVVFFTIPEHLLLDLTGPWFWLFALLILLGCVVELLRSLALATLVTLLVPTERHANANGLVGTVQGISFIVTSVFSGLSIGLLGMQTTMIIAVILTALPLVHLMFLRINEPTIVVDKNRSKVDFSGGMKAIRVIPGLFALIIFTMLNNLGGGVHMALLDAYGLTLMSPELWGTLFAVAGLGYVIGGAVIAKRGLGANPLRTMLLVVMVIGVIGATFTLREWLWLLLAGMFFFMMLMPAVEAAEQTVIQRVVPFASQGRVFGLAATIEAAAAPVTAFLIAPIAQYWVVPSFETGNASETWAWLLGDGEATSRGIALVFFFTGIAITLLGMFALKSKSYQKLSASFANAAPDEQNSADTQNSADDQNSAEADSL